MRIHVQSAVDYLPIRGHYTNHLLMLHGRSTSVHALGSEHAGKGDQFMGVVELPEGVIVELKLTIDRKPTNTQSKVLLEAELVQKIDKYLRQIWRIWQPSSSE